MQAHILRNTEQSEMWIRALCYRKSILFHLSCNVVQCTFQLKYFDVQYKCCPSSQPTNIRYSIIMDPILACYCYHDMMLIFRAIDAFIQYCHIEILVTTLSEIYWIYFNSSDSGYFCFIFHFFNCRIWTFFYHRRYICHFTVAIVIKYHTISFLYSGFFHSNHLYEEKKLKIRTYPCQLVRPFPQMVFLVH